MLEGFSTLLGTWGYPYGDGERGAGEANARSPWPDLPGQGLLQPPCTDQTLTPSLGDAHEARGVALADRAELPLRAVAVELAEDHGGLGGGVLAQVVTGDLGAAGLVDDADVGVADLAEVLRAVLRVVDGDGEDDLVDVGGEARQVDVDRLVVARALARAVVAGVDDGLVRVCLLLKKTK